MQTLKYNGLCIFIKQVGTIVSNLSAFPHPRKEQQALKITKSSSMSVLHVITHTKIRTKKKLRHYSLSEKRSMYLITYFI